MVAESIKTSEGGALGMSDEDLFRSLPAQEWLDILAAMHRIREFEEEGIRLFRAGELPGFLHPSVGQEAVAVTMTHFLRAEDVVTSTHRGHGHIIAKGGELAAMYAELYGKEEGSCRGRGGSMHIMDWERGILGANGIVGGGNPIATGAGLAFALDDSGGDSNIALSFFGDGAVNQGSFHEALNLAAIWELPTIFVCENNQYAESTPFSLAVPISDLRPRGASYGMPTFVVDGNDVVACLRVAYEATARARSGKGPTLIQADTYRWYGHHLGDVAQYRTQQEIDSWKEKDPIKRLEERLREEGILDSQSADMILASVRNEIKEAVEVARNGTDPEPATATEPSTILAPAQPNPPKPVRQPEVLEGVTMRQALQFAYADAMEADPNVITFGEDIADSEPGLGGEGGAYKITEGLSTRFGRDRVRNTPISEAAIVGAAIGSALVGKRPIAELMYIDFTTIAMDQIVSQAALIRYMSGGKIKVPLVIRCQGGAWRGSAAQHSRTLEAWFAHVPGLKFVIPSNPTDAYWLLRWAVEDDNPVIFYEPNLLYRTKGDLDLTGPPEDLLRPAVRRTGDDVTLVGWGQTVSMALEAATKLESEGISAEVVDLKIVAPLNLDPVVQSLDKTGVGCVVHEAWRTAGLGAEISAQCTERLNGRLAAPIARVAAADCPHPFAPQLEQAMMPSSEAVIEAARSLVSRKG